MRGAKSTLALLAVLIGLGAYIYFVTWKQEEDAGVSKQEKVFAGLLPDDVQELTIKSEKGEVTSVKRQDDGWHIVTPVAARASTGEVSTIITALQGLEIARVIEENTSDLNEYGLASPRIDVEFKVKDGKPGGHLLIGQKTPIGGNMYAKRAEDKRVLLIADYQDPSFNKSTFDLRDKTIIAFKRDAVTGVDLNTEGKTYQFSKSGDDWRVTKPLAVRADSSATEGLVGKIETAQMKSLVTNEATPADLKKYGLDKPVITVDILLGSGKATFAIGGMADGENYYARDAAQPVVVTIEKALAEDLKKPLDDYRQKSIFEFRAYNVDHIELTRNGQTTVFERVKSTNDTTPDSWKRVSPNPKDVDREKMETLLTSLADIRAASFQDSTAGTGLDAPLLTIAAKFEEGKKEERVKFGKTSGGEFAATVDPGAAKLEADRLDEIVKTLDELTK